jgi:hypothetical protein
MRPPGDEASPLSLALIASRGSRVAIAPGPPTKRCDGERKKLNCGLRIMVSQSLPSAFPGHFGPSRLTARTGFQCWVVLYEKVLAFSRSASFPPARSRRTRSPAAAACLAQASFPPSTRWRRSSDWARIPRAIPPLARSAPGSRPTAMRLPALAAKCFWSPSPGLGDWRAHQLASSEWRIASRK